MRNVLALVLAGGKGSRLEPLTRDRAKPAVPFGGMYRIVDFALSNCINSGLRKILLLTQYKALSLDRHINLAWRFLCRELGEFIDILPPEQRIGEHWYRGTADAVYQNIYSIEHVSAEHILILAGDHIYKMDYSEMVEAHIQADSDATVACLPVKIADGREFGVMGVDAQHRVVRFEEKPAAPFPLPGDSEHCLASMGIYVFKTKFLFDQLCRDATLVESGHDFGRDIIPEIIHTHQVRAFLFHDKNTGRSLYWRDVGTLDAYYEANMDLVSVDPELNLYDQTWPIRNYLPPAPPPKFVFAQQQSRRPRVGQALDSMVCPGTIVSGGQVRGSILGPFVRVNSWAQVDESILFEGVDVGRNARIRRAIIDKGVQVPEGMQVGFDAAQDRARGFVVTESGVTVIGKLHQIKHESGAA
ncbi:MAG: glucose-1-phosphate adenylyltransferase [Planctomycetaceae bacterium]